MTERTMVRARVTPGASVTLERVLVPLPGAGEVRVRTVLAGVCGSDTHALAGHHPFLDSPYIPGHEAVGVVDEVGGGVHALTPGQRVLLKPNVACGHCPNCLAGRTNTCQVLTWVGCDTSGARPGAMAEFVIAPERNWFAVPDEVDDVSAVLVECLATPVHAVRVAPVLEGQSVAVLGAGTIGLLAVVAARLAGAARVVVTDTEAAKLARAVQVGAAGGVDAASASAVSDVLNALGGPADVVLDCVAARSSIAQGVELLRRGGTLVVTGVPTGDVTVPLHLVQDWEVRIQGCAAYTEVDVARALEIAASGAIPVAELVHSRIPLTDAPEAFATASRAGSGKVLIEPTAPELGHPLSA